MGALERAFAKENAVIGHNANGVAIDGSKACNEGRAVEGLEL